MGQTNHAGHTTEMWLEVSEIDERNVKEIMIVNMRLECDLCVSVCVCVGKDGK